MRSRNGRRAWLAPSAKPVAWGPTQYLRWLPVHPNMRAFQVLTIISMIAAGKCGGGAVKGHGPGADELCGHGSTRRRPLSTSHLVSL